MASFLFFICGSADQLRQLHTRDIATQTWLKQQVN
jgi:hypothetical protein